METWQPADGEQEVWGGGVSVVIYAEEEMERADG